MADYRKRVKDSHAAQAEAARFDLPEQDEDDMGDLTITGDIEIQQPQKKGLGPLAKTLAAAAIGAGLTAAGIPAGIHAYNLVNKSPPPANGVDTDTRNTTQIRFVE